MHLGSSSSVNQLRNSVEHLIQMDELIRTNRNSKKRRKDGPTCYSKFILFIAMLTSFITVFPFNIWNRLLDDLNTGNLSSINSSYGTPSISNSSFLPIVPNFDLPIKTDIPQTIIYRLTHCIPLSSHEHKRPNSTISSFNSDEQPIEPESSFFSFLDILHIVGVFSSLAFFEFVRSEFARVKQRSTFYMVRIVRETFGFF